ncbi:MAG TPA: HD domain-containing phosphohydrolase [Clostridia bacterium]|nr:HD domain-containing phosphohydrolase [Clostridia bacterium]
MSKLLIVDDEKSIRLTLEAFLSGAGFEVMSAENVQDAKDLLVQHEFDAILTDIIMPKESGVSLLKYVHEYWPNIQVVVMTGEPTIDSAVEAMRLGARDYLTKPVYKNTVLKTVSQVTSYKQLLDEKQRLEKENKEQKENLERLVEERTQKLRKAMLNTAYATANMLDLRDPYTAGHQRRVGHLASAIGRELGLPDDTIEGLYLVGCIHDVGKITVPADILAKPGKLSVPEYEIIKEHPGKGYEVLKGFEMPWSVAEIVYEHHERLDGSGYPRGLKENQIRFETQIISVADVVEAMMSHRPYRPGLGIAAALDEIEKNKRKLYNADVVDACITLFYKKGYVLDEGKLN